MGELVHLSSRRRQLCGLCGDPVLPEQGTVVRGTLAVYHGPLRWPTCAETARRKVRDGIPIADHADHSRRV